MGRMPKVGKGMTHKGWGEAKQARKGAQKANREQGTRKRLTPVEGDSIRQSEGTQQPVTAAAQQSLPIEGPVFYRCLSDPGDVRQRNPGEGVPYCRYCGFPMVRVGAVGREKRDRM